MAAAPTLAEALKPLAKQALKWTVEQFASTKVQGWFNDGLNAVLGGGDTDQILHEIDRVLKEVQQTKEIANKMSQKLYEDVFRIRQDGLRNHFETIDSIFEKIQNCIEQALEDQQKIQDPAILKKRLAILYQEQEQELRKAVDKVPELLSHINGFLADRGFIKQAAEVALQNSKDFLSYYMRMETLFTAYWGRVVQGILLLNMAHLSHGVLFEESSHTIKKHSERLERQVGGNSTPWTFRNKDRLYYQEYPVSVLCAMGDNLEERLKSHARAFEGLMSLIPAKDYYGKDESITSTQWQKKGKKQTLEERQAAKRAKLDPASHKSAKDVMDENALKRKRELEGEEISEPESSDLDMDITKEKPLEGIKSKAKKQKTQPAEPVVEENEEAAETRPLSKAEAKAAAKAEKRREKRKEKQEKNKKKEEAKKSQQTSFQDLAAAKQPEEDEVEDDDESADEHEHPDERIEALDVSGLVEEGQSTAPSTTANSNSSTASVASAASSNSSLPQSGEEAPQKKAKKPYTIDPQKHEDFRARLNAKLEAMRAARKADGPDGRPARNRAELIEARRKKEAEKKAAKKALRQDAKEDEARQQAEEQLARIRGGSGSPSIFPARSPEHERNFNFGKIAWDGAQLEGNLSGFLESKKKKGKSDAKTALEAAQKKQARLNAFDENKRKDIQEKDLWLAAKKRAQGEKVFDDVNLLKKSLKRQQKQKDKSKQEWKERLTNVDQGKAARQKKREENLKKRKEDKGQKGKKKVKKPGKKVTKRPGFEGTFKGK